MVGDAVPLNQLTNAVGLSSIVFNVARSAGPALAGFLIAICGTAGSYTAQAILPLGDNLDHTVAFRPAATRAFSR